MSGDSMIYDMSQMTEGSPQVFVKRDWLNLQDQNNGNYLGNQMVLDTSQLANSNKYMAYREAYFAVPLLLTASNGTNGLMDGPSQEDTAADRAFGLKSWFGNLIHSMTLDYAGTTIIQSTALCSMWQQFGLITTLSLQDVKTNGATLGFFPDTSDSWSFTNGDTKNGPGVVNNCDALGQQQLSGVFGRGSISNAGWAERQKIFAFALDGQSGYDGTAAYSALLDKDSAQQMRIGSIIGSGDNSRVADVWQCQQMAIIRLKDIHPFFGQVPLLKGVFMRLTLNLNQPSVTIGTPEYGGVMTLNSMTNPLGGVNPIFISGTTAATTSSIANTVVQGATVTGPVLAVPGGSQVYNGFPSTGVERSATISLAVGNKCLNQQQVSKYGTSIRNGTIGSSIFLYVPAYTFNPTFEEAYLASPTKTIVYTDIYQFTTPTVGPKAAYNQLITNGIANIKSVLVLPFFSVIASNATGAAKQSPPYQSPFDPAGCGPTSPLCHQSNFNVVVAGQNEIYNTQQYTYEQYINHLQGCNAVNANLIDGLTSGLVSQYDFLQSYCYYYVNTSRGLPVDEAVPKSVMIQGTNQSTQTVRFVVFIEYGVQVSVDVLTGSRV